MSSYISKNDRKISTNILSQDLHIEYRSNIIDIQVYWIEGDEYHVEFRCETFHGD